jgi:YVTN family beta-propeller protein
VYVANSGGSDVSVINTVDDKVSAVNVGPMPVAFGQFIVPVPVP